MNISFNGKGKSFVQFVEGLLKMAEGDSALTLTIEQTPQGDCYAHGVIENFGGGLKTQSGSEPQQTTSKTPHWLVKGALG